MAWRFVQITDVESFESDLTEYQHWQGSSKNKSQMPKSTINSGYPI